MKKMMLTLAVAAILSGCGGSTPTESMGKGTLALSNDDYRVAGIEFKKALQQDPSLIGARLGLAEIDIQTRNFESALDEIDKIDQSKLTEKQAERELLIRARAYHRGEYSSKIIELKATNNDEVNFYKVNEAIKQSKFDYAESLIQQSHATPFSELSKYLVDSRDKPAQEKLDLLPETIGEKNYLNEKLLIKLDIAISLRNTDLAIDTLEHYVEENENDSFRLFQLVNLQITTGALEDAEKPLSILLKRAKNNPKLNEFSSIINFEKGDYEKALSATNIALASDPSSVTPRLINSYIAIAQERPGDALVNLEFVIDNLPKEHSAQRLYIKLKANTGDTEGLTERALELEGLTSDDLSLFSSLGIDAIRSGDKETAFKLAKKAESIGVNDSSLGLLQLSLNDNDKAFKNLEAVWADDPTSIIAGNSLASAYLTAGKYDKANDLSEQWLADGKQVEAFMLKAVVASRKNEVSEAKVLFEKVLDLQPDNPMARSGVLETSVSIGEIKEARKLYSQWVKDPGMLVLLKNYISSLRNSGLDKEIEHIITIFKTELESGNIKDDDAQLVLGQSYFITKKSKLAFDVLEPLYGKYKEIPSFLLLYSTINEELGNEKIALSTYEQWSSISPKSPMPVMGVVKIKAKSRDYEGAIEYLSSAIPKFENPEPGFIILAQLQLKSANVPAFKETIHRVDEDILNSTLLGKTLSGVSDLIDKKYPSAALSMKPYVIETGDEYFLNFLIAALVKSEGPESVLSLLETLHNKFPDNLDTAFLLGNGYAAKSSWVEAINVYEYILTKTEKAPAILLNNLAAVLDEDSQSDKAEVYARRAVSIEPSNAAYLDTLGSSLNSQKRYVISKRLTDLLTLNGVS